MDIISRHWQLAAGDRIKISDSEQDDRFLLTCERPGVDEYGQPTVVKSLTCVLNDAQELAVHARLNGNDTISYTNTARMISKASVSRRVA